MAVQASDFCEWECTTSEEFHHFKAASQLKEEVYPDSLKRKWYFSWVLPLLLKYSLSCLTSPLESSDKASASWWALICWYQVVWISGEDILDFSSMGQSAALSVILGFWLFSDENHSWEVWHSSLNCFNYVSKSTFETFVALKKVSKRICKKCTSVGKKWHATCLSGVHKVWSNLENCFEMTSTKS